MILQVWFHFTLDETGAPWLNRHWLQALQCESASAFERVQNLQVHFLELFLDGLLDPQAAQSKHSCLLCRVHTRQTQIPEASLRVCSPVSSLLFSSSSTATAAAAVLTTSDSSAVRSITTEQQPSVHFVPLALSAGVEELPGLSTSAMSTSPKSTAKPSIGHHWSSLILLSAAFAAACEGVRPLAKLLDPPNEERKMKERERKRKIC